jgi:DNA-binding response OmpR family regulator
LNPTVPLRVLVADNDRDAADSLAQLVRLWGHDALVAYGGDAALEAAVAFRPEVAMLDVAMPGHDGNRLARQLRGRPGLRNALVVAVTGFADEVHRRVSLEAGFDRYLAKPVDPACLEALLELRCQARRLRRALRHCHVQNQELRRRCRELVQQAMHGVEGMHEELRQAWAVLGLPDPPKAPPRPEP